LNIPLVTHDGRRVRFYDDLVRGRVVTINFMFATCQGACPATTAHLVEVQRRLGERVGRDVTMLSITLDAERDTPDVLRRYAETYHVGPGWYFLTGDHDDIERLRRSLGVYDLDPVIDADRTQHAGTVLIGNEPAGRWSTMPALMKPVRIVQAIERAIAPPTEWVGGPILDEGIPFEVSEMSAARVTTFDPASVPMSR
jgi:protein SCO1/2